MSYYKTVTNAECVVAEPYSRPVIAKPTVVRNDSGTDKKETRSNNTYKHNKGKQIAEECFAQTGVCTGEAMQEGFGQSFNHTQHTWKSNPPFPDFDHEDAKN